jgi:hypothetical protein
VAHRCAQAASLRSRPGARAGDERDDELVEAFELAVEELGAPSQLAQRVAGGVADRIAGAGSQRGDLGYQARRGVPGQPGPQLIRPGQHQCPGLVDRPGSFAGGAAPGDHQRADRLNAAVAALRGAERPARLGGPGGVDRVERVGLALPAAVLPVGTVDFDDADAGRGDEAGQAGAIAAGPLDPDQADGPEPAQPAKKVGVAGRGRRELSYPEQPADGIQRSSDVHVRVGVHTAGHRARLYDGQRHPFLRLRDGTHRWPSDL